VQVERKCIATLHVGITCENGEFARRVVQVDPQHGETAGRNHTAAKADAHRSGLAFALQFKVAQAAHQRDLRIAGAALPAQNRQRKRAVRRKPRHAPVFKLNLRPSVVPSRRQGSLKQRRILQSLIGKHLVALRKLHLPVYTAQARRARCRSGILSLHRRRQQNRAYGQGGQPQNNGCPAFNQPSAIPYVIHRVPPLYRLRPWTQPGFSDSPTVHLTRS